MHVRLPQKCTYWTSTPDGFGGYTYGAPLVIDCRWQEAAEKFLGMRGLEEISRAVVFIDHDMNVNDWVYLGETVAADPSLVEGAFQVRAFRSVPDLRAIKKVRKVML
jgi:hypothetical protein